MNRSRPTRSTSTPAGTGQALVTGAGVLIHADAAFQSLALGGGPARPNTNLARSARLAAWNLSVLLREAKATGSAAERRIAQGKGSREAPLVVRVSPVPAARSPRHFLIQVSRATPETAAAKKLRRERDDALRSAQQKGEFLANMSHELRTPLNAIIGFLRLVEDNEATGEVERKDYLRSARTAAMSLLELVNNILDLAKIEANRLTLEAVEFDPLRLMEEVCKTLAPQAHGKGIEVAAHAQADVPQLLVGDPTRLRQVLLNLAGNAVKFTEAGGVSMIAEMNTEGEPEGGLRFTVRDTGVGIPDHVQKNLFQSYVQRDGTIARRFGGTGLGLAICRQLVEQMGGTIGVHSREGDGSRFWFTAAMAAAPHAAMGPGQPLKGVHALVLDANIVTGALMMLELKALGVDAIRANSTWEAENLVVAQTDAGRPVQLAIVDQSVHRDAALGFAHSIRTAQLQFRPDLIYLAPIGQLADADALRGGGYAALLTKPVPRVVLVETAKTILRTQTAAGSSFAAPARKAVGELSSLAARHQVRVLVAEDNAVNQKLIHALLTKRGFQVTLVPNGKAAVQAVLNDPYDIVLMDVQMPVMDGLSATREIRRRVEGRLPVVAMTADAMEGDRERCLAAGMDDYLSKPILPDQLSGIMEHWLGRATTRAAGEPAHRESAEWGTLDHAHLDSVAAFANAHQPEAFEQLAALFQGELERALAHLTTALAGNRWPDLADGARSVATLAEGFGAPRLQSIAEDLLAQGNNAQPLLARDLVTRLQAEAKSVLLQVRRSYGAAIGTPPTR